MTSLPIAFASDHAGFELRKQLSKWIEEKGWITLDLGTYCLESVDYPDYAEMMAVALKQGKAVQGVLVCGTGIGISIAANRFPHVRAALCHCSTDARLARLHNDANVIAFGGRTIGIEVAKDSLDTFLTTAFEGGRHQRRLDKMS